MASGRVPVIISDPWVEPKEIDWTKCAVRVPESQIGNIVDILKPFDAHYERMAACASDTYKEHFSPRMMGTSLVRGIASIRKSRRGNERWHRMRWPVRTSAALLRAKAVQTHGLLTTVRERIR